MATDSPRMANGAAIENPIPTESSDDFAVKAGLAQMLKGGVIMDVVNAEQVTL